MTTYTYVQNENDYVTDDGVHISVDAMAAIENFSNVETQYVTVTGSSYIYELHDAGALVMSADDTGYNNAFNYSSPGVYSRDQSYHSLIVGNDADNVIEGNDGDSWFSARADTIFGGQGNDLIFGYRGNDELHGDDGNDVAYGGAGNDTLFGGNGDDFLFGGDGTDTLYGGDGNDWLFSGHLFDASNDSLTGGAGIDTFVLGDATDEFAAAPEVDWGILAVSWISVTSDVAIAAEMSGLTGSVAKRMVPIVTNAIKAGVAFEAETTQVEAPTASYATIEDFNPTEDVLIIPIESDGRNNVFIDSDWDIDHAFFVEYDTGTSLDVVATITFDDAANIYGDGFESLSETAQQAFIESLKQSALIISADGAVMGLDGDTVLDVDSDALADLGTNAFIVIGAYSGWYLQGESQADYLFGTQYGDVIAGYNLDATSGTFFSPENAGDDELRGFGGDDVFYGGGGNDYIDGGSGSDTSSYVDSVDGISVDLSVTYTDANGTYALADDGFGTVDKLFSIENIVGSDYDDTITGDDGDNVLVGGAGNDTISGGGGDDTIAGGTGQNTLDGGDGFDTLSYADADSAMTIDLEAGTATDASGLTDDAVFNFEAVTGSDFADTITGDDSANTIRGGAGDDTIAGGGGDDTIHGGDGNDALYGGDGNDVLYGGDGNDALYGGDGDDVFYASSGTDTMTGGAGADTFIFDGGTMSVITDFDPTEDIIMIDASAYGFGDLTGAADLYNLAPVSVGDGTALGFADWYDQDNPVVTLTDKMSAGSDGLADMYHAIFFF